MDNKALTNQIISTHNDSIIAALVEEGKKYLLSFNLENHATIKIEIKDNDTSKVLQRINKNIHHIGGQYKYVIFANNAGLLTFTISGNNINISDIVVEEIEG